MHLLWPDLPPIPGLPNVLAALLPRSNFNAAVLKALADRSPTWNPPQNLAPHAPPPLVPLFLADPFLNWSMTAEALRRAKIETVVALPSATQFGAEFAGALEAVKVGAGREALALAAFAQAGFATYATMASDVPPDMPPDRPAENGGHCGVIVAPQFDDLTAGRPLADLLRARLAVARRVCSGPVWVAVDDAASLQDDRAAALSIAALSDPAG